MIYFNHAFKVLKAHKQEPAAKTFQCMNEYKLTKYNGDVIKVLYFQFYNGKMIIHNQNGLHMRDIEESSEYTYKILKRKIKASGGFAGLLNFTLRTSTDFDDPLNRFYFNVLDKIA
ncbi:hypothetical protein [Paenibacillus cremeus]|uniref:Uncharacterized protein n=1 Tax=Paenibacillus cremeus TaxID=2163881 RepID=A0A559KCT2_9BACL|nr:hypothetical protein [Paenibacillus cremeus]TVY09931.1 hypothetical protein FPZ49_11205 [Paenibacillus cremeus]